MTTSGQTIESMLRGYRMTQLVHVVAKLGVADALADGPRTAEDVASSVGANSDALSRVLRALPDLFERDAGGRFSLTDEGGRLRSDVPGSVRIPATTYGEPWFWKAWGGLFDAVVTGATAFDAAHGVDLFGYLARDPEAARLFDGSMSVMTTVEAAAVARRHDFSHTARLVDIGGGHGALAAAILAAYPAISAVLFDRAPVIAGAPERLRKLGIADRCTLVAGDFFVSVPDGADTYTLKDILHDWDDEKCRAILRNVKRAMPRTSRLLVIERVIRPGNEPSIGKLIDISMLVLTGGRERTEAEYRVLLASAGFATSSVTSVEGETSILEAIPE